MTEQTNTPILRFKGFNDEWSLSTIGALGDFYYGKSAPKWSITKDVGIPCIRYGELYTKFNNVVNEIYSYTSMPKEKLRFSKGGEILIPRVGEDPLDFAKCVYLPQKDIAIGEMISVYNTKENPLFLTYYFNTKMKYEFAKRVEGASVSNLYYSYLEDIKLKIPDIREQQKLGVFFSKLDRQIELEEQKLEKLEEQKKGYMQKLFSQELRFKTKDNVYYSEWQLHKLGEIFKYSQGQQISVDKQFSVMNNGMKRFIRIVDITENPEPRFVLYESDAGLVNKGDLFMIRYGRPGIVSIGFEGIIANNLFKLIPKIKISTIYFYYLLSYNYYRINLLTNQSTMPALNFKSLDLLKFKIPSYKEQNKIANFLESIDKLVIKQSDKVKLLKQRKKGLLQKMFV